MIDEEYSKLLRQIEQDPENPNLQIAKAKYERRLFGYSENCHLKSKIKTLKGDYYIEFSPKPGLSVVHGMNSVGKTQLLKATKAHCGGLYYNLNLKFIKHNQIKKDNHSFVLPDGSNLACILNKMHKEIKVFGLSFERALSINESFNS